MNTDNLFSDQPLPKDDKSLFSEEPAPESISKTESFLRGVTNNVPLLPQAASALTPGNYSTNLADWNYKANAAHEANPWSYRGGAATGVIGTTLIPGVGEAMEAAPIISGGALGAANAVSNKDLTKDVAGTIRDAAIGGGLGAGTSAIMGAITPKISQVFNKAANAKAVENTGLTPSYLKELSEKEYQELGPYIRETGLVGTNKQELLKSALETQKNVGEKIGSIGEELTKRGVTASEDEILQAADSLLAKAKDTETLQNPELRKLAVWHTKGANDILNQIGDDPTWESIQKLKQAYGKAAFSNTGEVKNEASKNVYFTLRDMLQNLTQKAQDNPDLPGVYKQALNDYHKIDPIVEGLSGFVGRERAGIAGHGAGHGFLPRLIRSLPGQHNPAVNLGTAAVATAFSPHIGPLMALPTLTNPAIQSKAASGLAKLASGITPKIINQGIIDYLASLYANKEK